jgi:SAM-dependent methyltransferase
VRPLWHPLSTILLAEPPCWATTRVLELLFGAGPVALRYAGDRMWPALGHGAAFEVERRPGTVPRPGESWLVARDGIPDVLRVAGTSAGRVRCVADADPELVELDAASCLARVPIAVQPITPARARLNRMRCELGEAATGRPDAAGDPARTVEWKYSAQACHYGRAPSGGLEPALAERFTQRVERGGRVLVVGSGTGPECFALAELGYRVEGVDFSEAMVEIAREEAARRGGAVTFTARDVRGLVLAPSSLDGVLFTYDVYSFLPLAAERVETLRALARALAPQGAIFVSARRARSAWERFVLSRQWLARRAERPRPAWGASHTRWIAGDGSLRRSFIHVFTQRRLADEVRGAGLLLEAWQGAHGTLSAAARGTRPS